MDSKNGRGRHRLADWYEDRRKKIFRAGLLSLGLLFVMTVFGLRNEYLSLQGEGNQRAADRIVTTVVVIILVLGALVLLVGWWYFCRIARRLSARLEAEFEASIADLSPEEQAQARHNREMLKTLLAVGASVVAHEGFVAWQHRSRENLQRTRERNEAVNRRLEEDRERFRTSWDDRM